MKPLSKENRQYLLNHFRYTDHDRPNLRHTMEIEWLGKYWVCTTNASAGLFLKDERDINVDREAKTVNIRAILPESVVPKELDIDRFKSIYDQIPIITRPMKVECGACDGDGKFEHCGEYYKCKSCNETGLVEHGSNETIKDPDYFLQFKSKFLAMERFDEFMKLLNLVTPRKLFHLDNLEKQGLIIFQLDDDIIIALAITNSSDTDQLTKLIKCVSYYEKSEEVKNG